MLACIFATNCPHGFPLSCDLVATSQRENLPQNSIFFFLLGGKRCSHSTIQMLMATIFHKTKDPSRLQDALVPGKAESHKMFTLEKKNWITRLFVYFYFFFFPASEVAQCTTCRYLTNYCGLLSFYFQNHRGCKCNYLASWLKCENTNLVWRQTVTTIISCFSGPCETEEGKVSPLRWSATHSGLQSTKECRQQNLGACMPRLLLCIRCGLYNSKAASDIFWFSH